jgi:hypothetical protein
MYIYIPDWDFSAAAAGFGLLGPSLVAFTDVFLCLPPIILFLVFFLFLSPSPLFISLLPSRGLHGITVTTVASTIPQLTHHILTPAVGVESKSRESNAPDVACLYSMDSEVIA